MRCDKALEILEEIRNGSEIGKLYGNGVCHLGKKIGYERIPHVKGQGISGYDPRVFKGMSVTYATSPMGADHTAGAAIAGRTARSDRDYGELTENDQKLGLSYELQIFTAVLDSMGVCYFIGPNYKNMELVAKAINAMYGTNLSVDDVHLNLLPLFHVAGLFMATGSFHAGALSVNMSRFDAQQAVDLIAEKKVTVLYDFSPILSSILDAHEKSGKNIKSLKAVKGIENPETIERYQKVTGGTFFLCLRPNGNICHGDFRSLQ